MSYDPLGKRYKNALTWPEAKSYPAAELRSARDVYHAETARLEALFKADFLKELGVTDHPKANKLFSIAWSMGHSSGYSEVMNYGYELVELIED